VPDDDLIDVAGEALTAAEIAALQFMHRKRAYGVPSTAFGTMAVLDTLYRLSLVSKCGRLFHAITRGDRVAEAATVAGAAA
jgi:hypothetical protein